MIGFGSKPASAATARPQARRRKRGGRGALMVIAAMLALSGGLRLGAGIGWAEASAAAEGPDDRAEVAGSCETPDDIARVLALLKEREDRVVSREGALADRLQALAVAETQIASNMAALEEAEARLSATMAHASTAAEDDLARLTSVYENMKAKEAAPVFAAMDPKFAAGFLGRMRPDAAAAIMAGLDPEAAYAISVLLAGRNALAPTE